MTDQCVSCQSWLLPNQTICPDCKTPVKSSAPSVPSRRPKKEAIAPVPTPEKTDRRFLDAKLDPTKLQAIDQSEAGAELITQGLARYYREHILPLEKEFKFPAFASPSWNDIDFSTAPQVLLVGAYSTGKTSFINYLVERNVPGSLIGNEPTTAKFSAICGVSPANPTERVILGNAAACDKLLPFANLQGYGINFLNRFEVSICNSPILQKLTFIDTPGVLSGQKQLLNRDYNFAEITKQFASTSSCILLLFDCHKLDISDELSMAMNALKGHEDKLHIILNKADSLSSQELLRVYGSLMWSLGRVFVSPEALRVFIGSFWSQPYQNLENKALLEAEEAELLAMLRHLPKTHSVRLVNEIVKRARQVRTHCLLIDQLKSNFGFFSRKAKVAAEILQEERLIEEFKKVQTAHNIPIGDFPKMSVFKETIETFDITKFPDLDKKKLEKLDWVLSDGIPNLMRQAQQMQFNNLQKQQQQMQQAAANDQPPGYSDVTFLNDSGNAANPFDESDDEGPGATWSVPAHLQSKFKEDFFRRKLINNKLSGAVAKPILMELTVGSDITSKQLKEIWSMADIDMDGYLDADEYILCCYLITLTKERGAVPQMTLELCPPSKREQFKK